MPETIKIVFEMGDSLVRDTNKKTERKERKLRPKLNDDKESVQLAKYCLQKAKNLTMQSVKTISNRYFNMSENYLLENQIEDVKTIIDSSVDFSKSIVAGAKIGAAAGLGGAVVGGLVGGASAIASSYVAYSNKLSGYYSSLNATNMNTEWNSKRLGLNDGGRGTEN